MKEKPKKHRILVLSQPIVYRGPKRRRLALRNLRRRGEAVYALHGEVVVLLQGHVKSLVSTALVPSLHQELLEFITIVLKCLFRLW